MHKMTIEYTKDSCISLSYRESYTLNREDGSKCSMWIIDKFFFIG